jgi:hypothetical protein
LVGGDNIEKRLYSSSYLRWCVLQALDSIWEISANVHRRPLEKQKVEVFIESIGQHAEAT